MKKNLKSLCFCYLLMIGYQLFAQNPSISTDLPNVIPPSPTVAGLMKFEEVPVNNYTGIPDISIPLYGVQSRSGEIGINLSLNYHPGSIAAEEVSGFVGLGWSLFAGGTISRTVRGLPDEMEIPRGGAPSYEPEQYGIYSNYNPFYQVNELRVDQNAGGGLDMTEDDVKQFVWEAVEKGWYDTEHDLYQYNFMGYSGRFIIKKSGTNYIPEKLGNDNAVKIEYNHATGVFILYDDKGNKYTFDIKETTTCSSYSDVQYFVISDGTSGLNTKSYSYTSAYHLSKITDFKNTVLAEFEYNPDNVILNERTRNFSKTTNRFAVVGELAGFEQTIENSCYAAHKSKQYTKIEPMYIESFQILTTKTKKLQLTKIPNKAKIYFTLEEADLGTDVEDSYRLKEIKVYDWYNTVTPFKNFKFEYTDSYINNKFRMLLQKVTESDAGETRNQSYELSYFQQPTAYPLNIGKDYWGYFNNRPAYYTGAYYSTTPSFCRIDALKRMTLPTGGAIDFNFESNTYSYEGDTALESFDNEDYWTALSADEPFNICPPTDQKLLSFVIDEQQEVTFTASVNPNLTNWKFVYSLNEDLTDPENAVTFTYCSSGCSNSVVLDPGTYYVGFNTMNPQMPGTSIGTNSITVDYRKRNNGPTNTNKFFYGGGVRIGSISYFENVEDVTPVRKKNYSYNFFNDKNRSSGSLTFPKPIFRYKMTKQHTVKTDVFECPWLYSIEVPQAFLYEINTTFNNLKAVKTHAADVGYKNVTVHEIDNGRSEYTYTSAIDHPEMNLESNDSGNYLRYPFWPTENKDYQRGVLKNERHFDKYSKLLSEITYGHFIIHGSTTIGFTPYNMTGCKYGGEFAAYENYLTEVEDCDNQTWYSHEAQYAYCQHCGYAYDYLNTKDVKENFGWVKLTHKTTKEYFYKQNNTASILETKEYYTYNNVNKKPESVKKDVYQSGNLTETEIQEYFYLSNTTVNAQNRISEILRVESTNEGALVAKQEITHISSDNSYYPGTISSAKGTDALEARVVISKYDAYKNPLEVSKKDGIKICYIRDWNTSEPLAMVQNATYAQVVAALGAPLDANGYTQADISAFNNLRTALPDAMVTIYTYKPLVGVKSITDPRGNTITYEYDTMGRLVEVRDHLNRILSQNEYKYRTEQE